LRKKLSDLCVKKNITANGKRLIAKTEKNVRVRKSFSQRAQSEALSPLSFEISLCSLRKKLSDLCVKKKKI
jgi:hypothetical protein